VQTKQLSRGKVTDRPWGMTLAAIGSAGHSGYLTVTTADKKQFRIAIANGFVVDASSPVSADSFARVALTARMIPAPHAAEITKRMQRKQGGDELAIVAEVAKLGPDELARLRHLAIVQRVARTFSLEAGTYRFDREDHVDGGPEIDIEEIVYNGARLHIPEPRVTADMRMLGSRFVLKTDARPMVVRFAFSEAEIPMIDALQGGTSLAEIDATHRDIDPRTARAAIYALACCDVIEPAEDAPAIATPRTSTESLVARTPMPVSTRGLARHELETMVADRCSLIDAGRDLFAVLGLEFDAPAEAVRSAYLELVGYIHPDKIATSGLADHAAAQRLWARTAVAYATLCSPEPRACYLENHIRAADPTAEIMVVVEDQDRALLAHQGAVRAVRLMASNRPGAAIAELAKACELAPADVDHRAMLAWAMFCAVQNKQQLEAVTRRTLEEAIETSKDPEQARLYLGRMERMLGHDLEALQHFRAVLEAMPDHVEAQAEVRVIEARLARGTKPVF
jgi:hypothetical protein